MRHIYSLLTPRRLGCVQTENQRYEDELLDTEAKLQHANNRLRGTKAGLRDMLTALHCMDPE